MLLARIHKLFQNICIFSYDFFLTLFNVVTPKRRVGSVTPHGSPGAGGKWPGFTPPKERDNGPRAPRSTPWRTMVSSPAFTDGHVQLRPDFTALFVARYLNKDYNTDTCDLAEIGLHNTGIEHDASLLQQDVKFEPDQGAPYLPFIDEFLASASGKDADGNPLLAVADLSRYSAKRRAEARATNPDFVLDTQHKMFGSSNCAGLVTIFGGCVADLQTFLKEERFPDGWESRVRMRMGMTFLTLNRTVFKLERGIKEEDYTNA